MTAIDTERNEQSISRKAKTTTKPKTGSIESDICRLKSTEPAVLPVTGASVPGTLPTVAGTTCSRSAFRASAEAVSLPLP